MSPIAQLSYITAGESHGPSLAVIVSGLPSGLAISRDELDRQLARRQAGYGRSPRQSLEQDRATVTGGVRHGLTLGSPVAISIANRDHENWSAAMSVWPTDAQQGNWRDRPSSLPRPGHADLGGIARGGFDELRPVLERSSARETASRVAAGSLAQQLLADLGIDVFAHVRRIGGASTTVPTPDRSEWSALDSSQLCCLDPVAEALMLAEIDAARADRDTLGGIIEVVAYGLPPGIGGYATGFERLDGRLAAAALRVQAMKGVEFGAGMDLATRRGSAAHDEMDPVADDDPRSEGMGVARRTNHAGGIEGGMTNGAPVVLRVAMKPLPTLMRPLDTVDLATGEPSSAHAERSDTCAVSAAAVVLECEIAFELARVIREQFGMQSMADLLLAWEQYRARTRSGRPAPSGDAG